MFCARHRWRWPALAGIALGALVHAAHAVPIADPTGFLAQTEQLRTRDHPRFVRMLEQIHHEAPHLSSAERWYLRYLDAWQTSFQGDYAEAATQLREVIAHSGNVTLEAKASALLLNNLGTNHHYEEAFALANRMVAELPRIHDKLARFTVLSNLSQSLSFAGQHELAIKYARMMEDTLPPGETLCIPRALRTAALSGAKRLTAASPELRQAIDICVAAGQPVVANTMQLVLGDLYLDAGQPDKTLALLRRIIPSVQTNQYYYHQLAVQVQLAQAWWQLGNVERARKAALAAVAMAHAGDINPWLKDAYEVLYRLEKKRGHAAAALDYHEHYVVQDKGYLDDLSASTLAYQTVQQQLLAGKLEAEALAKQNDLLRLQQALDTKAVEASRLYILLLLMGLGFIMLWLYRLKRSQLRFKRLSRHDSLTGIFNHQHFMHEADRVLRLLERQSSPACLMLIDMDHFKQINDTHGHAVGDAVLQRSVTSCQRVLRPADVFGRLGGEEFGILLHDCSREQGMQLADRMRATMAATPLENNDRLVSISASIGLTCTDITGYDLQRLCIEADAALYRAKRAGRNRVIDDRMLDDGVVDDIVIDNSVIGGSMLADSEDSSLVNA